MHSCLQPSAVRREAQWRRFPEAEPDPGSYGINRSRLSSQLLIPLLGTSVRFVVRSSHISRVERTFNAKARRKTTPQSYTMANGAVVRVAIAGDESRPRQNAGPGRSSLSIESLMPKRANPTRKSAVAAVRTAGLISRATPSAGSGLTAATIGVGQGGSWRGLR